MDSRLTVRTLPGDLPIGASRVPALLLPTGFRQGFQPYSELR
jgi:hypothetical protein